MKDITNDMLDFFLGDSANDQARINLRHECEQDEEVKLDVLNHWYSFQEGSDREWMLFDEEFYALLKKHTGVEFNEEPKDFDLYCSMRDKIWEEIQKYKERV